LLAIEDAPVRASGQPLHERTVAVNLPSGWRASGVAMRLPGTATAGGFYLTVGLGLMFFALTVWLARRQVACGA
jgi:hypothetical protein